MQFLTVIYWCNPDNTWDGIVQGEDKITVCKAKDLPTAQDTMYILLTDEMWHRYKNLSSWVIATEIIHHQGFYMEVGNE